LESLGGDQLATLYVRRVLQLGPDQYVTDTVVDDS
jgi:hypothetical protein